ncbi:MAG: glycosyltransferase family 39 protein [Chloroflexota bacterium]|nr:glycosyltransferase family 39 protein [Chloroflexota bacterium]
MTSSSDVPRWRSWLTGWRGHWPVLLVFVAFAAAAVVVPTLAPVATTDDWGYARSAQLLVQEQRLVVFPVVAATAVFQVVWGALFGWLFGPLLGVFRLSTVVMVAIGAVALYGLCRELGIDRQRSALGTAAYLFNPLLFVLAFTFMTDPHFVSLLLIAAWGYARGLRPDAAAPWWVIAGSGAAGLALLTRQQGVLIPLAVVVYLLVARRLRFNLPSTRLFLQVVALPLAIFAGYALWLRFGNDVPDVQAAFLRELVDEGWAGTWWLIERLTVVEVVYLGFFTLPIVVAALVAGRGWRDRIPERGWPLFLVWTAVLTVGVTGLWVRGMRMPYIGQFLGAGGPGPPDVLGSRPRLLTADTRGVITIVCVAASLALAVIAARAIGARASPERATAGLVLSIALWQVIGIFPPSYHYIGWTAGSLDRYLLPLIPLAICLTLWALRERPLFAPAGWIVVALFAIFATAGTRDYLVYMKSVWGIAYEAVAAGVPLDQLDAGAAWDGYFLYEYSLANLDRGRTRGGPWWVYFYGRATDSTYVISSTRQRGFFPVWKREYATWLNPEPTFLYLQRRPFRPWPPTGTGTILDTVPVRPAAPGLDRSE